MYGSYVPLGGKLIVYYVLIALTDCRFTQVIGRCVKVQLSSYLEVVLASLA